MATHERLRIRGRKRGRKILAELAGLVREARLGSGLSQQELGKKLGVSGDKIGQIENDKLPSLSILEASELCAVIGFDFSARMYPNGAKPRDAGQAKQLVKLIENVGEPLKVRTEVALPKMEDRPELRAWDAVVEGDGERTAIELESRLSDLQATLRAHNGKRRDDPVDHFLLVIADTRHNRQVVREFADLLTDLPRLRTASVLAGLRSGRHPPTGFILL